MNAEQWKLSLRPARRQLKSTTVLPVMLGIGVAGAGLGLAPCHLRPAGAASAVVGAVNPEAMPRNARLVACNPCNPCAAAKPCGACNPCAASKLADPCSPCAAANPCNPCAAANPCNPCNPCAAAAGATTECLVPRLQAAAANPCNPCAAANPCSPCNPCAAASPCNPCATASPCNPCAAANPCNPCAAGDAVELTDAEAADVYDCVKNAMEAAYSGADDPAAGQFLSWTSYSLIPYQSATHGNRYVMNYANAAGEAYGRYEDVGTLPAGAKLAKNSFTVDADGRAVVGPLFLMEKMAAGFNEETGNWRYTMIMPDGSTFGVTDGQNAAGVEFCNACHAVVGAQQDYLYFMPEEYRVAKN